MGSSTAPDKKSNSLFGELVILGLGLLFIGYVFYLKIRPTLLYLWATYGTQIEEIGVLTVLGASIFSATLLWNRYAAHCYFKAIWVPGKNAVNLGVDESGRKAALKQEFRIAHAQIIGTTSAGKTESAVLPWAIHDVEAGTGLLIIDGKSDHTFLEKLYAYVHQSGRARDFRLFSLANIASSSTFNPLVGGEPEEVAERVFSSFEFENEHYKNLQYQVFLSIIRLIRFHGRVATFSLIQRLLTDMVALKGWNEGCKDENLKREIELFMKLPDKDRSENISGLVASLSHFSVGKAAELFNTENPTIDLNQVLEKGLICYFQLPTLYAPFLGRATGKLVLQSLQGAVAGRHLGMSKSKRFFSCFLDDFQDYIYPGFGSLLNKSRSANVGVVFSHQSNADLSKVSPDFRDVVLTCTNVKVVMRNNHPETCEYFSKSFGTQASEKTTERQSDGMFGKVRTGDGSVRDVEEYKIHPNVIKELGTGEGIVSIPHPKGTAVKKIKFSMRKSLMPVLLPAIEKIPYDLSKAILAQETKVKSENNL